MDICLPGRASKVKRAVTSEIRDRKSTRLNSSHLGISYAVFCLKKKMKFRRGFNPLMSCQIRLAAHIGWVKASEVGGERGSRCGNIVSEGGLQQFDRHPTLVATA